MSKNKIVWLMVFLVLGLMACTGDEAEQAVIEPKGPALIMFYTDG